MKKKDLANELRKCQLALGEVEPELINRLSDHEIIESYITCDCCGEKEVTGEELKNIIKASSTVDDFFEGIRIVPRFSCAYVLSQEALSIVHTYLIEDRYSTDSPLQLLQKALMEVAMEEAISSSIENHLN
jgi:hypothetical protein